MSYPSSSVPLLVIGDGLIGQAIVWQAAQNGVEASWIGDGVPGASHAAAGMLAPSFEGLHHRSAAPLRRVLKTALTHWDGFAAGVQSQSGMSIDYSRIGIIGLDIPEGAIPAATDCPLPADFTAQRAIFCAQEGQVDPRRLLSALRQINHRNGAQGFIGRVAKITDTGVLLEDGTAVQAERIVLAAGSAASALSPHVPRLTPIRGRAFLVYLPGLQLDHVIRTENVYFCPKADGTIYIGATEERADEGAGDVPLDDPLDVLWQRALAVLPSLSRAEILQVFDGDRPASPVGAPIIALCADNPKLIYALGHDRNGVLLTPWTAKKVLELVAG